MTTRSPDAAGDAGLNRSAKIGGANVAVEVSLWEEFAADEIHSRLSVAAARTVVLACADNDLRRCLAQRLMEAHWQVREAYGGAAALLLLEQELLVHGDEAIEVRGGWEVVGVAAACNGNDVYRSDQPMSSNSISKSFISLLPVHPLVLEGDPFLC